MADPTMEQWRDRLLTELISRRPEIYKRRRYYDGDHVFPTAPNKTLPEWTRLAELGVTNFMALVVDTVCDRLTPRDVRLSTDDRENLEIWQKLWKRNNLDAESRLNHEEATKVGRGFVLVWPDPDEEGAATVTVEDPADCIVAYRPGSKRARVAALKVWRDDSDITLRRPVEGVTVWTADEVRSWRRANGGGWEVEGTLFESGPNPLGVVPMVEFRCKPSVTGRPSPEISKAAMRLQDRINKTMFDAVVSAEYGAFPQRYTIGVEVEVEFVLDEAGQPILNADGTPKVRAKNPLAGGPNRVWALQAAQGVTPSEAKIGQLPQFDINGLLRLADTSIKQLASITQTPAYALLAGADNIGAEFLERLETGHAAKIEAHQHTFGSDWSEVIHVGLIAMGREAPADIEIGWLPANTSSPTEQADQAAKLSAAGTPFRAIQRQLGRTPSEIERMEAEAAESGELVPV